MDKNQNKALSLVTPSSVYITKREFPRKKLLHSSRMPSKVSLCLWKTYTAIFTSSLCLKKSITFLLKESKFLTSRIKKKKKKRPNEVSKKKTICLDLCQGAKKSFKIDHRFRVKPYSCSWSRQILLYNVFLHICSSS